MDTSNTRSLKDFNTTPVLFAKIKFQIWKTRKIRLYQLGPSSSLTMNNFKHFHPIDLQNLA